jgi:hypothetical protein
MLMPPSPAPFLARQELDGVLKVPWLVPSPLRSMSSHPRQEDRRRHHHSRRREPQAAVVAQGQIRETMRIAPDLLRLRVVLERGELRQRV